MLRATLLLVLLQVLSLSFALTLPNMPCNVTRSLSLDDQTNGCEIDIPTFEHLLNLSTR